MLHSSPEGQSEGAPQRYHRSLQDHITALWARSDEPDGPASSALQQQITKVMGNSEETERKQSALELHLDVTRDAVIRKWMAKPSLFDGADPVPLEPEQTPVLENLSSDSTTRPTRSTSPMYTSSSPANMHMSARHSSTSAIDISISPIDSPRPTINKRITESIYGARSVPPSALYASHSHGFSQNDDQQDLAPVKKRQKRGRFTSTKSSSAEAYSQSPATIPGSSSHASGFGPSQFDTSSPLFVDQTDRYPVKDLPEWYTGITDKHGEIISLFKKRSQHLVSLESLKDCIGRCEVLLKQKRPKLTQALDELRNHVHKAEIKVEVTRYTVRKTRMLHKENGLPRIFSEDAGFPADLRADSYWLYLRWHREDFDPHVLRGITTVKGPNRGSDKLDPNYRSKFPASAKKYGDEGLVNGQCWPSQLCLVRDGVHGSTQGGIFGDKEKGTYSIVLFGGGGYHDQDDGTSIVYSGTDGKDSTPTEATQQMILSASLRNVIRVIRSCNLKAKNKYRPEVGFRYDGLYQIHKFELVDKEKQIYLFTLDRCPGQPEIRWGKTAMSRPTEFEIEAYKALKIKY